MTNKINKKYKKVKVKIFLFEIKKNFNSKNKKYCLFKIQFYLKLEIN